MTGLPTGDRDAVLVLRDNKRLALVGAKVVKIGMAELLQKAWSGSMRAAVHRHTGLARSHRGTPLCQTPVRLDKRTAGLLPAEVLFARISRASGISQAPIRSPSRSRQLRA